MREVHEGPCAERPLERAIYIHVHSKRRKSCKQRGENNSGFPRRWTCAECRRRNNHPSLSAAGSSGSTRTVEEFRSWYIHMFPLSRYVIQKRVCLQQVLIMIFHSFLLNTSYQLWSGAHWFNAVHNCILVQLPHWKMDMPTGLGQFCLLDSTSYNSFDLLASPFCLISGSLV